MTWQPCAVVLSAGTTNSSSSNSSRRGNRRGALAPFLRNAVLARRELNPPLHEDGKHTYMVAEAGEWQQLHNSLEGQQFALACRCANWHVRFATLHSITREFDLFCQWCECGSESWQGRGKDAVSVAEKEVMQELQGAGLDHTTACQVRLPFWRGRIDFYHIPSRTSIQADGSSHFYRTHHKAPQQQQLLDIECCRQAWEGGQRLLRVHHMYAHSRAAMIVATQLPYKRFVMLTGGYSDVQVWVGGEHTSYSDLLQSKLVGAHVLHLGVPGCVCFYSPTL